MIMHSGGRNLTQFWFVLGLVCLLFITVVKGQVCDDGDPIGRRVCPRLFLLGVQKGGSSALHVWFLRQRTTLVQPVDPENHQRIKEVHFFDRLDDHIVTREKLKKYLSFYPIRENASSVGYDATPGYFRSSFVPKLLSQVMGNVKPKFLIVFRDPVKRGFSWYKHLMHVYTTNKSHSTAIDYFRPPFVFYNYSYSAFASEIGGLVQRCVDSYPEDEVFTQCARDNPRWEETNIQNRTTGEKLSHVSGVTQIFTDGLYGNILLQWFKYFPPGDFCIAFFEKMAVNLHDEITHFLPCLDAIGVPIDVRYDARLPVVNYRPCQGYCEKLDQDVMKTITRDLNEKLYIKSNTLLRRIMSEKYNRNDVPIWEHQ